MTDTELEAFEAMLLHHQELQDQVTSRVDALHVAVTTSGRYELATAQLLTYLAEEVLPHAMAEEHSIYEAAGDAVISTLDEAGSQGGRPTTRCTIEKVDIHQHLAKI